MFGVGSKRSILAMLWGESFGLLGEGGDAHPNFQNERVENSQGSGGSQGLSFKKLWGNGAKSETWFSGGEDSQGNGNPTQGICCAP